MIHGDSNFQMRIVKEMTQICGAEYPIYETSTQPNLNLMKQSSLKEQEKQSTTNNLLGGNKNNSAQNVNTNLNLNSGSSNIYGGFSGGSTTTTTYTNPNQKEQYLNNIKKKCIIPVDNLTLDVDEALVMAKKLEKDMNQHRNNMIELQNLMIKLSEEEQKLQSFEVTNLPPFE